MMQVQNQIQQISEEFLLPLSEDELASIAGGDPPRRPCPTPDTKPGEVRYLSNAEVDAISRCLAAQPRRPNPLDERRRELIRRRVSLIPGFGGLFQ